MKVLTLLLLTSFCLGAAEPVLSKRSELIFEDAFSKNLNPVWKSSKGIWQVTEGRLVGQEPEGNNHAVHLAFTPEIQGDFIIELDMLITTRDAQAGIMFNPGKGSAVKGHIGRVTLTEKLFTVRRDKSHAVKKARFKMTPTGKWFHLTLELVGDTLAAQINDKEYRIQHEDFKKVANKKLILLAGKTVEYKNFKLYKAIANE